MREKTRLAANKSGNDFGLGHGCFESGLNARPRTSSYETAHGV
jgi:hypothetical protein